MPEGQSAESNRHVPLSRRVSALGLVGQLSIHPRPRVRYPDLTPPPRRSNHEPTGSNPLAASSLPHGFSLLLGS